MRGGMREIKREISSPNSPLVISSSADVDRLAVDETVVCLGVPVGQVAGLRGERFLHSSLLQQEAAVVTDNSPGNVRGNHLGFYTFMKQNYTLYSLKTNFLTLFFSLKSDWKSDIKIQPFLSLPSLRKLSTKYHVYHIS